MTYLIALDDGHGMKTNGKRTPYIEEFGRFIHENEFNREVVRIMDKELRRLGFKTLLVAPTDYDTPLQERTDLANKMKADAYISIHYDAFDGTFEGKNPAGHSLHVYPGSDKSMRLAKAIHKYYIQGTVQNDRGIKESNFHVLRETNMAAILSENGFMDNEREAKLMLDKTFQREVAIEHVRGLCDYFNMKYKVGDTSDIKLEEGGVYKVKNGDTLYNIAKKHDTTVEAIVLLNKIVDRNLIMVGDSLKIPKATTAVNDDPIPKNKVQQNQEKDLKVDGYWGPATTRELQGEFGTPQDGKISTPKSMLIVAIQKYLGLPQTGKLDPTTIRGMQKHFGTQQDGIISKPSMMVKEMQRRLNQGRF